jgi:hypothetical protein
LSEFGARFEGPLSSVIVFAADLVFKMGRKLLEKKEGKQPKIDDHTSPPHGPLSIPAIAGLVTTGVVVGFCIFLCACFQRKRKATAHTVLAKDPNSSEYSFLI